jgi:predicted HicB family RNase H-like nuclease
VSVRKDILVYDIPEEIRLALVEDAQERNRSLNEVVVQILGDRFKVNMPQTLAPFTDGEADRLSVRAGPKLHQKIALEAAKRSGTLRGVVLESLALNYHLDPPPIGRRPRTKGAV